jgi:hypothetical protein
VSEEHLQKLEKEAREPGREVARSAELVFFKAQVGKNK